MSKKLTGGVGGAAIAARLAQSYTNQTAPTTAAGVLAGLVRSNNGYPDGVIDTRGFTPEEWLLLLHHIEKTCPEALERFNSPLYKLME